MDAAGASAIKPILLHGFRQLEKSKYSWPLEAWFLLKFTPNGAVISEIFKNVPLGQTCDFFCWGSNCARIGSSLYVLGGQRGPIDSSSPRRTDCIRRLDLENPNDGWKPCQPLRHPCSFANVGVSGNLIFLFPQCPPENNSPGGLIYDASKQQAYIMNKGPPGDVGHPPPWRTSLCFSFANGDDESNGVAALAKDGQHLNVFNGKRFFWEELKSPEIPPCNLSRPPLHAFLNGILYLSYCNSGPIATTLYAFNLKSGEQLFGDGKGIQLPKFEKLGEQLNFSQGFLVALADYKLCYLWSKPLPKSGCNWITINLATVVVSSDGLSVTIVSEDKFPVNASHIQSCIPLDSCPDQIEEIFMPLEEAEIEKESGRTRKKKLSLHKLKQKQREEFYRDYILCRGMLWQRMMKRAERNYYRLANLMRSKNGMYEVFLKMKRLEKKLKVLEESLCNKDRYILSRCSTSSAGHQLSLDV